MVGLEAAELHGSLRNPVLGAIGFLNEVMSRHPDAISFAPGAPHPTALETIAIERYAEVFLKHLVEHGRSPEQARRLLFEYGPARGIIGDLVAQALRCDLGIAVPEQAVVITVGAQEGMFLVLRALFRSRSTDVLAVGNPCFAGIAGAAALLDVQTVPIPETSDGLDLDALVAACRAGRAAGRRVRACYTAADFANPGGGRMSGPARERLLALAEREDFLILEDDTYGFTALSDPEVPEPARLKALDRGNRVVHIGTFAKTCFPGARVGYVLADQPVGNAGRLLADELADLKTMVTVNTSPLSQAVIGGMLLERGEGSLARLGERTAGLYRRNLALLLRALDRHLPDAAEQGVSWNRPGGGFFVRMRLPVRADVELLERCARTHRVLWTPMDQFHLDHGGDDQIRLSCSYLEPDRIDEGVRRLADFLSKEIRS